MANQFSVEGARIMFRNFSGKPDNFNPAGGRRSFCLVLDPDTAEDLKRNGWNVRCLMPRDENEDPLPYIQVKVNYANIPPHIYLVTKSNKTLLTEETVGTIDYAEISDVDVVVTGSSYNVNGKEGISAYVKNMYVTIVEDEFADKYKFDDEE